MTTVRCSFIILVFGVVTLTASAQGSTNSVNKGTNSIIGTFAPLTTLPSGKKVKITGIVPMHFSNGGDAMILNCETDISIDDMPNLRKEAVEIWSIFQKDVEGAHMTNGVIRITHPEGSGWMTHSKGYGFVFEKRADGQWHCLQDEKK